MRFFDPEMERKLAERRIISTDLRRAVERDELVLFYQPQTTLDGEITGFDKDGKAIFTSIDWSGKASQGSA